MSQKYSCVCPHCKQTIHIRRPAAPGRYKYTCTACGEPFAIAFKEETQPLNDEEETHPVEVAQLNRHLYATIGGLRKKRSGLFGRKQPLIPLRAGRQLIGREDSDYPSDIAFDDPRMSRQSVELTVEQHGSSDGCGYSYVLRVRRLLNPVMHNGMSLRQGEVVVLSIGDTITLGNTTLILQ